MEVLQLIKGVDFNYTSEDMVELGEGAADKFLQALFSLHTDYFALFSRWFQAMIDALNNLPESGDYYSTLISWEPVLKATKEDLNECTKRAEDLLGTNIPDLAGIITNETLEENGYQKISWLENHQTKALPLIPIIIVGGVVSIAAIYAIYQAVNYYNYTESTIKTNAQKLEAQILKMDPSMIQDVEQAPELSTPIDKIVKPAGEALVHVAKGAGEAVSSIGTGLAWALPVAGIGFLIYMFFKD